MDKNMIENFKLIGLSKNFNVSLTHWVKIEFQKHNLRLSI